MMAKKGINQQDGSYIKSVDSSFNHVNVNESVEMGLLDS